MVPNDIPVDIPIRLEDLEKTNRDLLAFAERAQKAIDGIANSTKKTNESVGFLGSTFGKLSIAAAGINQGIALVQKLGNALEAPIHAAIESEDAVNNLNESLRQSGRLAPGVSDAFEKFAEAIERTSKFSDEAALSTVALLADLTNLDNEGLKKATQAAVDLAAATGDDLGVATKKVADAIKGGTIVIKGATIELGKGKDAAETAAKALDELNARFGGRAQAQINTFGGSLLLFSKATGNVVEEVGKAITGVDDLRLAIVQASDAVQSFADLIKDNAPKIRLGFENIILPAPLRLILALKGLKEEAEGLDKVGAGGKLKEDLDKATESSKKFAHAIDSNLLKAIDGIAKEFEKTGKKQSEIAQQNADKAIAELQRIAAAEPRLKAQTSSLILDIEARTGKEITALKKKELDEQTQLAIKKAQDQRQRIRALVSGDVDQIITEITVRAKLTSVDVSALGGSLVKAIGQGAKGAESLITGALSAGINAAVPGLGLALQPVIELLAQGPDKVKEVIGAFIAGIPQVIDQIGASVGPLIAQIIVRLPALITTLIEQTIPTLLDNLITGAFVLVDTLTREAPKIITVLAEKFPTLATIFMLKLIELSPQLIVALTEGIIKNAPEIVRALTVAMINGQVNALITGFEFIINGFVDVLNKIPGVDLDYIGLPRANFAKGGEVPKGYPNDSFLGGLTSGENVIKRDTNEELDSFLADQDNTASMYAQMVSLLKDIKGQLASGGAAQNLEVKMVVADRELAKANLELDRRGFRTRV